MLGKPYVAANHIEASMYKAMLGVLVMAGMTIGCGGVGEDEAAVDAMASQEAALAPTCQPGETSRIMLLCGACGSKGNYKVLYCIRPDGTRYEAGIISQDCKTCI